MNVFVDTSIVNYVLDLEEKRQNNPTKQEDIKYLKLLLGSPVATGDMTFYVNPSVKWQINNTPCKQRKEGLLTKFKEFQFIEFSSTSFPIVFPVVFMTEEQSALIKQLRTAHPKLGRDAKIMADAAFNNNMDVLLTTDRKLAHQVCQLGKVKFMLPKELWDSYQTAH